MKHILFSILFLFITVQLANCQTWQTISKVGTYETAPYRQFSIDPYTNNLWLIHDTKVSVIENDGTINIFTDAELGTLWTNDNIHFAFTPTDIYYGVDLYGLFSFTGYVSTVFDANINDFVDMSSNLDTLYVTRGYPDGFLKYNAGGSQVFYKYYSKINAKHNFFYGHDGSSLIYQYDQSTNTQVNLTSDPNYLFGIFHDTKFSRLSDTLFVGGKKGISYAYNYDFLDTITPNNTTNMPSPNVLEIEFDHLDSLWAVFGDVNDVPFAIAKLEGSTWNNIYNASNSPIDFSNFLGLEIDTLGNLWVADNQSLHTLLTPNSPTWLNVNSLDLEQEISIYPNPGSSTISIQNLNNFDAIKIIDLQGRTVLESHTEDQIDVSSLKAGNYIIQVFSADLVRSLSFIKD
ncbi:MAG: hypothetical protein RI922_558 [Bacteroidota bacterium]|jgi:hypothetical protein